MEPTARSIGFIGLGVMGKRMVQRLASRTNGEWTINIFDVSPDVVRELADTHRGRIFAFGNSREVTTASDIVMTMVPEGQHLRAVYMTADVGVLATDLSHKILIDCSTVDISTSTQIRSLVHQNHASAAFYDCPVSGGSIGADNGTLTFMLGCSPNDENITILREILSVMGQSIIPCGGPGLGLTAKFCNNYCSGIIALATSEAFHIAISHGMDPRVLHTIFKTSTAGSTINDVWNPVPGLCPNAPSSNGYQGGFKVQLMRKDMALAVEAADQANAKLALAHAALQAYNGASGDPNCKDLDARVVFRYIGGNESWATHSPGT